MDRRRNLILWIAFAAILLGNGALWYIVGQHPEIVYPEAAGTADFSGTPVRHLPPSAPGGPTSTTGF